MSRAFLALAVCFILVGCQKGTTPSKANPGDKTIGEVKAGEAKSKPDAADEEYRRLEGTWLITSYQLNGVNIPDDLFNGHGLTFQGNSFTRIDAGGKTKGTFKLNSGKTPKTIDMTDGEDAGKSDPVAGIYEIEGNALKICLAIGSEDRPKEFAAKKDSGHAFQVLKREKPTESDKPAAPESPEKKEAVPEPGKQKPTESEKPAQDSAAKKEGSVVREPGKIRDIPKPATVEEATKIIDLREFPRLEGAEVLSDARPAEVSYRTTGDLAQAREFYRRKLAEQGWTAAKEPPPGLYADRHLQLDFQKVGFHLHVVILKENKGGITDKDGKFLRVVVTNHGNVDVRQLPRPTDANPDYLSGGYMIYTTSATVPQTAEFCRKQITALGWEERADDVSSFRRPDYKSLRLVSNGMVLRVTISVQKGKTTVHYGTSVLDK